MPVEVTNPNFSRLTRLSELSNAWKEKYPDHAEGGLLALRGFEHQFLLTLQKIVAKWKVTPETDRQDLVAASQVIAEAVSDIAEVDQSLVIVTQVKTTLSKKGLSKALDELWKIFLLAAELTPELVQHSQFVISGKFQGNDNPQKVINSWGIKSKTTQAQALKEFKEHVRYELVPEPKIELIAELRSLSIENPEITINCWLGSLLSLGSGLSSECVTTLIWKDLLNDQGTKAIRVSFERVINVSRNRLCGIQTTLGQHITFSRTKLAELKQSILENEVTLLTGPSGSGKSALCKLCIQEDPAEAFEHLFFNASDIATFSGNREIRRLDEILTAQLTQKSILIVIDDLGDTSQEDFEAVLSLLCTCLKSNQTADVRFLITVHTERKTAVQEKICARLGNNSICQNLELPQLPIAELQTCERLPTAIIGLINRYQEFGPALNLKLIDWLVRSNQDNQEDLSVFDNDLDLLNWVWQNHIQDGDNFSDIGQALIKISNQLASSFMPDLPRSSVSSIDSQSLRILAQRDCLRLVNERITLTHRFIGDCARFYSLQTQRREIEAQTLVTYLESPFWVQPIRWFTLQLALESKESDTWVELLAEALEGEHLQLLDLLIDGAILSKQPDCALQGCPNAQLPFVIERLLTRLLIVATQSYHSGNSAELKSLKTEIAIQEAMLGTPKTSLWVPAWYWLLTQSQEAIIKESCIVFKAAEAWLNWNVVAQKFPLRAKIANFTLNLAARLLLNNSGTSKRVYAYLGDFEANAFACIVFALRIIPDYAGWFLRVLAGRELISINELESIQEVTNELEKVVYGADFGVLREIHLLGPKGKVNDHFRKFMLSHNGLFLNAVILAEPKLGVELFLALTIEPPKYIYRTVRNDDLLDHNFGTAGSDDIDVCTFKFLPLLSLLQINETIAIGLVNTLCNIVAKHKRDISEELNQQRHRLESDPRIDLLLNSTKADIYDLMLVIENTRKTFIGGQEDLYAHRNHPSSPKIINCLLMTMEGWLYSRPTRKHLETSITNIFKESDTVAMLGVLISLAKCDLRLVLSELLPLVSSLQLLVWLESEQQDRYLQGYGADMLDIWYLPERSRQELVSFYQLSHREHELKNFILHLWVNKDIPLNVQSDIQADWEYYQLAQIPNVSNSKALKIREQFRLDNWKEENDTGESIFRFVGQIPNTPEEDAKSEAAFHHIYVLGIVVSASKILKGEQAKTLDLHNECVQLIENKKQLDFLSENLKSEEFWDAVWASVAIILEPPSYSDMEELNKTLTYLANSLLEYPITANYFCRRQVFDLDFYALAAHSAPKIIKILQSEKQIRLVAFRCLVGIRNKNTSSFVHVWLKEYGLTNSTTRQLLNIVPCIARLITLTYAFANAKYTRKRSKADGTYISPREEISNKIHEFENFEIGESWNLLKSDFINKKISDEPFHILARWIPENLSKSFEALTRRQKNYLELYPFNWEFLVSALIPVFELKDMSEEACELLENLRDDVLNEFLSQRRKLHEQYGRKKKQCSYNQEIHRLSESHLKFIKKAFLSDISQCLINVNKLLQYFRKSCFIDLVLLDHIIKTLTPLKIRKSNAIEKDHYIFMEITLTVGDFLTDLNSCKNTELAVLGDNKNVWKRLVIFLDQVLSSVDDLVADQSLTNFFDRYRSILYMDWALRKQLHSLAKESKYKQFRRTILNTLTQQPDFLPKSKSDDSTTLVQVLAEYWDSDQIWITAKECRCKKLRALLSHFQKISAVGANQLADLITMDLSGSSN